MTMLQSIVAPAFLYSKCYYETFTHGRGSLLTNFKVKLPRVHSASRRVTSMGCSRPQFSTMSHNSSVEYCWIDGVERLELYEPGGYHPVMINDLLHNRYRIVDKLGFGGYSTIWLARDEADKRYVAIKIGISSPSRPGREPEILRALHGSGSSSQARVTLDTNVRAALPSMIDAFDAHGPNGTHPCYTITPAQGSLKEASFSRLFPVQVARALAAKLTTAIAFVHSQGFVHGGLFAASLTSHLPHS
jgi:serine/threonine-protein kinase SRPK3